MDTDDAALAVRARRVAAAYHSAGLRLAAAESCTGGWLAKLLTDIPGSSGWFLGSAVTYSNSAKSDLLAVPPALIREAGAVSLPVAEHMAEGARERFGAHVAVAITGIAGPGGGTASKPVGTVCFSWAGPGDKRLSRELHFDGDRESVRRQSVAMALDGLLGLPGGPG